MYIFNAGDEIKASEINSNFNETISYLGDASDGNVTIDSNTSLSEDKFYDELTVDNATLDTNGYRLFANKITLQNGALLVSNGGDGGDGGGDYEVGDGGVVAHTSSTLPDSIAGRDGGNDDNDGKDGYNSNGLPIDGVDGGDGYGQTGGVGGIATKTIILNYILDLFNWIGFRDYIKATAGSGSGAGGVFSGGGGSGAIGGHMLICAKEITINTGCYIQANGGDGGDGGGGSYGAGGGGAGNGGFMGLVYNSLTNNGTIEALGGTGGVGGSGDYFTGSPGQNGNNGTIRYFQV